MNTAGFKEDCVTFLQNTEAPGSDHSNFSGPVFPAYKAYQRMGQYTNFSQGVTQHTGNKLDLAINGSGYFAVQAPQGTLYTRKGNFTRSEEGILVTRDGYPLMSDGGEIQVDDEDFYVDSEGNVSTGDGVVGTLQITDFPEDVKLTKVGETFFVAPDGGAAQTAAEDFEIKQGYLEMANVNAVKTMTAMIETLRVFESYQKAIKTMDDINSKSTNNVGAVTS
jgi:flagellar basal-body rod protein FlgG